MTVNHKELSKIAFNEDAAQYDSSAEYRRILEKHHIILEELMKYKFSDYLDIGCGTGSLLNLVYQSNPNINLYGIDLSEEMIRIAKRKLPKGTNLSIGDSEKLPYENGTFQMISCTFSFHHYPNPEKVINEINRVLTFRGKLILVDAVMSFPLLQLANLLIRFSKKGDYKFYSRSQYLNLMANAGLKVVHWSHIGGPGYLIVADKT